MLINVTEEIDNLMSEGWSREQAILRTHIALELRKGKGAAFSVAHQNRYRDSNYRYPHNMFKSP